MLDQYLKQIDAEHRMFNDKAYYNESMRKIYLPLMEEYACQGQVLSREVQEKVFSELYLKVFLNQDAKNTELLNREEIDEFFDQLKAVLQGIDDDVILNSQGAEYHPSYMLRHFFVFLKHGDDGEIDKGRYFFAGSKLACHIGDADYTFDSSNELRITCLNLEGDRLVVDAAFIDAYLVSRYPDILSVRCGDKVIPYKETGVFSLTKVFGRSICKRYTIQFSVSLSEIRKSGLKLCLTLDGVTKARSLEFFRCPARIYARLPHSYWMLSDDEALVYDKKEKEINIIQLNEADRKNRERAFRVEAAAYVAGSVAKHRNHFLDPLSVIRIRRSYWKNRDKYKGRRIWLYFDKLFKAGDNGEYAFRYVFNHDKEIESYYVINANSPDYQRLKEEFGDRILIYGSFKCKILALFAETIVATHPDIIQFFGYTARTTHVVKDLFNAKLVCIAHGVTIQKNADYQNRIYDNTMFYTTSSKYEVKHLLHPCYGYAKEQIALTGMARFDGLKNRDKKQILITPTWRRSLAGEGQRNTAKDYNEDFKQSNYFKIYNKLINDERIIGAAKDRNYRIIFLVHPLMSAQIDDYDRNDAVDIIPMSGDVSYEKVLTESSLMITDYSGIHYDFGYMRKPVVYYQPKEVPMRFEEGGMKFATMGFGPLCTEYEEAVRHICGFIESDCQMPDEYRKRADDFFAFDDDNNAARIHIAIKEWVSQEG